jgi:hypothetical protein
MGKQKTQPPLMTRTAVALELGTPTNWVTEAARRGIVSPLRDSNDRALFTDDDVAVLRKYRKRQMARARGGYRRAVEAEA